MRRFSIFKLMLVVAVVAANFALIRFLVRKVDNEIDPYALLIGVLPLAESLIFALAMFASRWRITLRRSERRRLWGWYSLICGPMMVCVVAGTLLWPDFIRGYLQFAGRPLGVILNLSGFEFSNDFVQVIILPLFLWMTISAPILLLSFGLARFLSRFRIVITERTCADSQSRG